METKMNNYFILVTSDPLHSYIQSTKKKLPIKHDIGADSWIRRKGFGSGINISVSTST